MYLYGASGHGKVVAEIAIENGISVDGFIDRNKAIKTCLGFPVSDEMPLETKEIFISIGNNQTRKKIAQTLCENQFLNLIHPKSIISKSANLGAGTVVMAGATINAETKIGKHCIINTNSSIDHDCVIEDFVHISPNVALAGNVKIGEGTHIGIGACVIQGIKIGKWATVGAGAVIIKDVPDYAVVVGNPGKILKMNNLQKKIGGGKTS
ncbi:MAG: acetyltransferase [Bergeyella sp.]